jgi:hypothetical protein
MADRFLVALPASNVWDRSEIVSRFWRSIQRLHPAPLPGCARLDAGAAGEGDAGDNARALGSGFMPTGLLCARSPRSMTRELHSDLA